MFTPHRRLSALGPVLSSLFLTLLLGVVATARQATSTAAVPLSPATPVARRIAPDETHVYNVTLKAREQARFDVEWRGTFLTLAVRDAVGKTVRELPTGRRFGALAVSLVAPADGVFGFTVRRGRQDASVTCEYQLRMSAPRRPEEAGLRLDATEELLAAGIKQSGNSATRGRAAETLTRAADGWRSLGETAAEALTLWRLGYVQEAAGDYKAARESYQHALSLWQEGRDEWGAAQGQLSLGYLDSTNGEREKAEAELQAAAAGFRRVGDKPGESEAAYSLGKLYEDKGKYEKARDILDLSVKLQRESGNPISEGRGLTALATVLNDQGLFEESLQALGRAVEIFTKNNSVPERRVALRLMGVFLSDQYRLAEAEKYLLEAQSLVEPGKDPAEDAAILNTLGNIKSQQGQRLEARSLFMRALSSLDNAPASNYRGTVLNSLGQLEMSLGRATQAAAYLRQSLAVKEAFGTAADQSATHSLLSTAYLTLGQYEDATRSARRAVALTAQTEHRREHALALNTLGNIYWMTGDYPSAIKSFEEAFERSSDRPSDLTYLSLVNLGGVYIDLGDLQAGVQKLEAALKLQETHLNPGLKRTALLLIGQTHLRKNEDAQARARLEEAIPLFRLASDKLNEGIAKQLLGVVALRQGKFIEAQGAFTEALKLSTEGKSVLGIALSIQGLGDTLAALNQGALSQDVYGQGLYLFRQVKSPLGEATLLGRLMNASRQQGRRSLAIFYGKLSINLLQSVRGSLTGLDAELRRTFLSSVEDIYRSLSAELIEEGRLPEALQVIELLKEEEYFQFTRRAPAVTPAAPVRLAFTPEEAREAARYGEKGELITALGRRVVELELQRQALTESVSPSPEQAAETQKAKDAVVAASREFTDFLRGLAEVFGRTHAIRAPADASDTTRLLQKRLSESGGGALLTTLVANNHYYVILTTPASQLARRAEISEQELRKKVEDFSAAVRDPRSDPQLKAKELYDVIFAPVASDLARVRPARLLWSLDGALRYVPVAALHDGARYIVERYQVGVVTLAQGTGGREPIAVDSWRGLGVGVSTAIENYPALSNVPLELREIIRDEGAAAPPQVKGLYPGRLLLNEKFTRAAFFALLAEHFDFVHIASHFKFTPGNETNSFLLLGDGDKLTLAELRTAAEIDFTGVELVTLSACETARGGANANGVELESFGVMAQRRGARAVLASLWPMSDSRSTVELMKRFYLGYRGAVGGSKLQALRRAQLLLLHTGDSAPLPGRRRQPPTSGGNSPYAHPAFWASFILIGEWD
jgi:CHAT domain-containing protein/tetratricopeptide (TPR) repeat protein